MDVDAVVKAARAGEKISVDAMHVMGLLKAYVEAKEEVKTLATEIDNLKAGNAALLKDAERLDAIDRFLHDSGNPQADDIEFHTMPHGFSFIQRLNKNQGGGGRGFCGKKIREVVDAFMGRKG